MKLGMPHKKKNPTSLKNNLGTDHIIDDDKKLSWLEMPQKNKLTSKNAQKLSSSATIKTHIDNNIEISNSYKYCIVWYQNFLTSSNIVYKFSEISRNLLLLFL